MRPLADSITWAAHVDAELDRTRNHVLRAGQTVTDTFSYQMSDGAGAPASANLVVTITGSNDAPVATA